MKFKDVAHLYFGCEGELAKETPIGPCKTKRTLTVDLLKNMNNLPKILYQFKPILRSLSSMTEDEDTDLCAYCLTTDLEHKEKWNALLISEAKRTTYLLRKGFDLFGLIESGEAIDGSKHTHTGIA